MGKLVFVNHFKLTVSLWALSFLYEGTVFIAVSVLVATFPAGNNGVKSQL